MKPVNFMVMPLVFLFVLLSLQPGTQPYMVKPAFELQEHPAVIEGMTYDPIDSNF